MADRPDVEIILPVYNEEAVLEKNTLKIKDFLKGEGFSFRISIVDNGSTDKTFEIAGTLAKSFSDISAFKLKGKNKGSAIRFGILNSSCPVVGYMDADLSADFPSFLKIYNEIIKGCDIAMVSRLLPASSVKRSFLRRFFSAAYSKTVRYFLGLPFFDYPCGFKLFKRESIFSLFPLIKSDDLFFDTELIFHAYKKGLKIKEVPINWEDRRKSRIAMVGYVFECIKGIWHLRKRFPALSHP